MAEVNNSHSFEGHPLMALFLTYISIISAALAAITAEQLIGWLRVAAYVVPIVSGCAATYYYIINAKKAKREIKKMDQESQENV